MDDAIIRVLAANLFSLESLTACLREWLGNAGFDRNHYDIKGA
jgi:hypothetical protein